MVEINAAISDICSDIEQIEKDRSQIVICKIIDYFVDKANILKSDHVGVFDTILSNHLEKIDVKPRIYISEQISNVKNAPYGVLKKLAFDKDINIAKPILVNSQSLLDVDLIDIIKSRGQDHIQAIAKRSALDSCITDEIVQRGNKNVIRVVSENERAKFSHSGFEAIYEKMSADPSLRSILINRKDIPASIRALIQDAKNSNAKSEAVSDNQENSLLVIQHIKQRKYPELIDVLVQISDLKKELVTKAIESNKPDQIMWIFKKCNLSYDTFEALLKTKFADILSEVAQKTLLNTFESITPDKAAVVLKYAR